QEAFEGAAVWTCHIFRAPQRLIVTLELLYPFFEIFGGIVVVETDDVRLLDLQFLDRLQSLVRRPIARPDTRRERLRRICRPCPSESLLQQWQYISYFVFDFHGLIRRSRHVIGFVPYVPTENTLIFRKMGDHPSHVTF